MSAEPNPISTDHLPILGPDDPPPYDVINVNGASDLVLVCDHAGISVPKSLNNLGLPEAAWSRHISHDIGAREVTKLMAADFDAVAILHNYSRLVIDCNRPLGHPESIIHISDDQPVPGNQSCTPEQAMMRENALFWPYHQTISSVIGNRWRARGMPPVIFSVHSFTPRYGKEVRPWDAGVLYNKDPRLAEPLLAFLWGEGLNVGDNQPYSGLESAYSIDIHGGAPGIAHVVIEINQDQIGDQNGQQAWANRLARALRQVLEREEIHRVQRF